MKNTKSVVLFSGGLDSTILLHKVHKEFQEEATALLFNYNQRHSRELDVALSTVHKLSLNYFNLDMSFLKTIASSKCALLNENINVPHIKDVVGDPQPPTYVPNRNMMFLSIAAAVAESIDATNIYYGAAEVDTHSGHWDCTVEFLDFINKTLNLNRRTKITIKAPFINLSKEQIIQQGQQLGVDFKNTHTCYNGEEIACGTCSSCSSRIQGFLAAGIKDTLNYKINIPWP